MAKRRFAEQEDRPEGYEEPRIRVAFEVVTEDSARDGDASERGWDDEEGENMLPDEQDEEEGVSSVDIALEFLEENGATEASSTQFHRGVWYHTADPEIDMRSGEATYRSFHLVEFTEEEQREIFDRVYGNAHGSSATNRAHRKWTRR